MRSYATLSPRFWTGETGRALRAHGRDAQLLAVYLISCPQSNMIGLYYLPLSLAGHELGMTSEEAEEAMRSCVSTGFCSYDWEQSVVFVTEMARHQLGPSAGMRDKRRTCALTLLMAMADSPLFLEFVNRYDRAYSLKKDAKIARGFEGASKGLRRGTEGKAKKTAENDHHACERLLHSNKASDSEMLARGIGSQRSENREQRTEEKLNLPARGAGGQAPEQQPLNLDAAPQHPQAKKPTLPFRAAEALQIIASASHGRFHDTNPGGQAVAIEGWIKQHPDRQVFALVGAYIGAGGESFAGDVMDSRWATPRNLDAALVRARDWDAKKRPDLRRGVSSSNPKSGINENLRDFEGDDHDA